MATQAAYAAWDALWQEVMMARKAKEFAVLAVSARTGNGAEICRVKSRDVALSIAAQKRYEDVTIPPSGGKSGRPKKVPKYERVTTMAVFANGDMEPVVVR
jgi:hypothetical protein